MLGQKALNSEILDVILGFAGQPIQRNTGEEMIGRWVNGDVTGQGLLA
jgi:hypothetical protein